jgi:hypothetical protein
MDLWTPYIFVTWVFVSYVFIRVTSTSFSSAILLVQMCLPVVMMAMFMFLSSLSSFTFPCKLLQVSVFPLLYWLNLNLRTFRLQTICIYEHPTY